MTITSLKLNYQVSKADLANIKANLERCLNLDLPEDREIVKRFDENIIGYDREIQNLIERHNRSIDKVADYKLLYELSWRLIEDLYTLLRNHPKKEEIVVRIKAIRNQEFVKLQRLRLFNQSNIDIDIDIDIDEIFAALLWMTERGQEVEDLIAVKNFRKNSIFTSPEIELLAELAENNIANYLAENDRQPAYCQVVCSQDDLSKFASELYLIDSYASFCIIMAPDSLVERLRQQYPIGQIHQAKNIPKPPVDNDRAFNSESNNVGETTMLKIVQFNIPINNRLKKQILDTKAKIIEPLGEGKFVLSVPNQEVASEIKKIPEVSHLTPYILKIDERLEYLNEEETSPARIGADSQLDRNRFQILESKNVHFPGILIIIFFRKDDRDLAAENLKNHQIEIVGEEGDDTLVVDLINYPHSWKEAFDIIKSQQGLRAIEEDSPASFFNNLAVPLIAEGVVPPQDPDPINSNSLNLTGAGETIAIADSGLDTGKGNNLHPDLHGRVHEIETLPESGTWYRNRIERIDFSPIGADIYSGHGTHVAGSAIGTGEYSENLVQSNQTPIKGIASGAKLFFQSRGYIKLDEQPVQERFDTSDLAGIFKRAYDKGARIHSNSWGNEGSQSSCQYTRQSKSIDDFMRQKKHFLVVVAAGNEGIHSDPNTTWIDSSSICPPATAKNCLTVGASENDRMGKFADTYGDLNSGRFPHPPFNNDQMADSVDDIAAFSSRGFCYGERYKPDVIAPGTFVLSTRSSQMPNPDTVIAGTRDYDLAPEHYIYMSGTSMATPLVAGCAALVRQYLKQEKQIKNPTAALVKATIIHSAQYIDYKHKCQESRPWVDHEQGWGRVFLANSLNPQDPIQVIFEDREEGLLVGEKYEYKVEITDKRVPIRIILAYTDYPGEKLINNLNLILYSPNNQKYYVGNYFENDDNGRTAPRLGPKCLDNTNNVEGIVIPKTEVTTGTWTIVVLASKVEQGQQDFALVASGGGLEIVSREFYQNPEERAALE